MKHKGEPNNRTLKGMHDLREIFKERINVLNGLRSDEIISLFYNLSMEKVKKLSIEQKKTKWSFIVYIKKYLIKTKQIAIIYKRMNKTIVLSDNYFGNRTLERSCNVFWHCLRVEEALGFKDTMFRLGKGIMDTGSKAVETTESERKEIEPIKILQEVKIANDTKN